MLERLLDGFYQIRTARVCSCALWIIGEYCTSTPDISSAFEVWPSPALLVKHGCACKPGLAVVRHDWARLRTFHA